jgi:hypothetical protein
MVSSDQLRECVALRDLWILEPHNVLSSRLYNPAGSKIDEIDHQFLATWHFGRAEQAGDGNRITRSAIRKGFRFSITTGRLPFLDVSPIKMKTKPETAEIYRHYAALLAAVQSDLRNGEALNPKGWHVTSGVYPNETEPQGAGMQVFRPTWLNEKGNGIHFETWMKKSYHEKTEVPFVLHIEISKARAGFGAKELQKAFLDQCGAELEENGYKLNERYAMEPIKRFRAFAPETFVEIVSKEFRFLSRFGKTLDRLIGELSDG